MRKKQQSDNRLLAERPLPRDGSERSARGPQRPTRTVTWGKRRAIGVVALALVLAGVIIGMIRSEAKPTITTKPSRDSYGPTTIKTPDEKVPMKEPPSGYKY